MKKLMIMGAGIYQVPLIRKAREMGIYTIAVSIPGNYPGFAVADEVCHINTVDYETVLKVAREKQIDGIVTAGTDVAVITIGKVCDELGLKGLSFEAARIASDKMLMKERYEAGGCGPPASAGWDWRRTPDRLSGNWPILLFLKRWIPQEAEASPG